MTIEQVNEKINYYLNKLDDKLDFDKEYLSKLLPKETHSVQNDNEKRLHNFIEKSDSVIKISTSMKDSIKKFIPICHYREDLIEIIVNTEQYDFDYRILAITNPLCPHALLQVVKENKDNIYTKFEVFAAKKASVNREFVAMKQVSEDN